MPTSSITHNLKIATRAAYGVKECDLINEKRNGKYREVYSVRKLRVIKDAKL